ncbi:hypothetical protein ABYF32_06140 [Buchananella felis]|uniref:hypothetical protein n=1 Tax=Buchananella felis TaxID=3231492 RepID=UPI0035286BE8
MQSPKKYAHHRSSQHTTRSPLIVVIPGVLGSVLVDRQGRTVYNAHSVNPLLFPEVLHIENELIATKPIEEISLFGMRIIPGYKRFINHIKQVWRIPDSKAANTVDLNPGDTPDLIAFAYDFRKSVSTIASELNKMIRSHLDGRHVRIYAHSMGGLIAAHWYAFLSEGILVDAISTFGTPFNGAGATLDHMLNGFKLGPLRWHKVTEVMREWDSGFDLLPHWPTIRDGSDLILPHELSIQATESISNYKARARAAHEENTLLFQELQRRQDIGQTLPFTYYYSQSRRTIHELEVSRQTLKVTSREPDDLPHELQGGDGTVATCSALPSFALRGNDASHRVSGSHTDLYLSEDFLRKSDNVPPVRGDTTKQPTPHLILDFTDVINSAHSSNIAISVSTSKHVPLPTNSPIVRIDGERVSTTPTPAGWTANLPPLPTGIHRVSVRHQWHPSHNFLEVNTFIGSFSPASGA